MKNRTPLQKAVLENMCLFWKTYGRDKHGFQQKVVWFDFQNRRCV